MIQLSSVQLPSASWQQQLRDGFKTASQLLNYLELAPTLGSKAAEQVFATKVPRHFAGLIRKGDIDDPLLKQVLAVDAETDLHKGYKADPVGDLAAKRQKGLIHKYHGRVLLMATGTCAVNCRYCFRRAFPYQDNLLSQQEQTNILETLRADNSISEVILSGGDPLMLSDEKIRHWAEALAAIPHIQRLRIHTRLPVVVPDRITKQLCQILSDSRLQTSMVLHINHPNELSAALGQACQLLSAHQVTLLNQSVLLKDVNDDTPTLLKLSENLFKFGVLPYYIHALDKAAGTHHFDISRATAQALHKDLKHYLPGYLVPKLVLEEAGAAAKTWIDIA